MDDIIVYVIVTIIIFLSTFINYRKENQKNKERATNQQTKPTVRPSGLPPFSRKLEDFLNNENQNTDYNTGAITEEINNRPYQPLEYDEDFNPANEGQPALDIWQNYESQQAIREQEIEVIEETKAFELELDTPDDIRKAFVHSLIFERKY